MQLEIVPGRVYARVFAHDLRGPRGDVPCHSWVTDGLRTFGHKEIVFTMVRPPNAGIEHAPHEPIALLGAIASMAQQARLVDAGGVTEVGPAGLFGRPQLRGVAYETAWPMDGVALPPGCLSAVALVGHEMDTVKRFGALRALARIGRAYTFFPTAPWCEPDRAPLFPPDNQTILNGVACASFPGTSALLVGGAIVVRIPRTQLATLAQSLPSLPPTAGVVFLLSLDPRADACLVWTEGQQGPAAITPPGSRAERMSGCFALFVPQQQGDGGNPFEDGFAFQLTDASWARVRDGLMRGQPLTIPTTHQGKALVLEWYDPPPVGAAAAPPAVSEMQMRIREPQADIDQRLGMQALVAYADSVEKMVQQYFANATGAGAVLELDVVLGAERAPMLQLRTWPELDVARLHAQLAALPSPRLRFGEIAFTGSFALWGGARPS
jgi:hypothetical protein